MLKKEGRCGMEEYLTASSIKEKDS